MKIAVLCSGNGTNLQAIIDDAGLKRLGVACALVVSDRAGAFALERARRSGIEAVHISPKRFKDRADFDAEVERILRERGVELVVLAGYMRILSPSFVKAFRGRIMNIHPALLPAFRGTHGVKDALAYGVKVTGVTVHFVDEELDHGPIVLQGAVEVREGDTEEALLERIHKEEHVLYPRAIALFAQGKLKPRGRIVHIQR